MVTGRCCQGQTKLTRWQSDRQLAEYLPPSRTPESAESRMWFHIMLRRLLASWL